MRINQILDKIDDNQLFVPAFQREYVWKRDNAKNLIASLIVGYPTGTMLTWETNHPPELKGKWEYDERQGAVKLILDGQQRITTLYMLIRGKIPPYYTKSEILNDTRGLYVNLETRELQYYQKSIMENNPFWNNITDILQRKIRERDIIKQIENLKSEERLSRELGDKISDNFRAVESIPEYEFIEQSIPVRASLKEAIDIFYIVNASGVNLTDAELALAQISGYWPKAREAFKEKLSQLKKDGFVFKLDFIVYCLLGILHNIGSDMTKLHNQENKENLEKVWELLSNKILDYVVNLLRSHAFVDHTKEINSVYALVPITVYIYEKKGEVLSENEIKKIVKWFYYSQIRQRYISQLPQKLDKDISIVVHSKNPFDVLLNNIKIERSLDITPDEFVGAGTGNSLFNLMKWYFKSKNAICFTTGIGIRSNMGVDYSLEVDHIFPYSILKERGYNRKNRLKYPLAQEITNRAILTKIGNRSKSNKLAEDYLETVSNSFPNALILQSVPTDKHLWKLGNYENFLQARREMLSKELNLFLQKITTTKDLETELSLDEVIQEGENNELEFKSSLRWDYQEEKINKRLEEVIIKSISAFANGEGGTLLLGVDDENEVLGLERDYSSLNGDKDKFELHLRNLINNVFSKAFTVSNIIIEFPVLSKKEICRIDINKSDKPIFIEITDKNGQKQEKFYARVGNSSQEFKLSELAEYQKSRFS